MFEMKILIYGLPKSGTTKLTYVISKALDPPADIIFEPKSRERERGISPNVLAKCLFGLDPDLYITPEKVNDFSDYDKKIWLARDPRDIAISSFLYQWYRAHNPDEDTFKVALNKLKYKERNCKAVPFHELDIYKEDGSIRTIDELREYHLNIINAVAKFVGNLGSDWFTYKYEDMIKNNFRNLNNYLGFPVKADAKVPKIYARVSRSKNYGNWRYWFTNEDLDFYKELYSEYMGIVGYDNNDWLIHDNKTLPKEIGSGYMENLFFGDTVGKGDSNIRTFLNDLSHNISRLFRF
jgi:hypothetical protein